MKDWVPSVCTIRKNRTDFAPKKALRDLLGDIHDKNSTAWRLAVNSGNAHIGKCKERLKFEAALLTDKATKEFERHGLPHLSAATAARHLFLFSNDVQFVPYSDLQGWLNRSVTRSAWPSWGAGTARFVGASRGHHQGPQEVSGSTLTRADWLNEEADAANWHVRDSG